MAEGIAVAASGVSIVSLALQILGGIKQLSDLWSSIKDAPKDINNLLNELELIASILMMVDECHEPTTPAKSTLDQAKKYCQDAANSMNEVVKELKDGLETTGGKRRWAAMKAALKKEKLVQYRRRLEGAKSMLAIAQQCYFAWQVLPGLFHRISSDTPKLADQSPPTAVSDSQLSSRQEGTFGLRSCDFFA